MAPHLGLNRNYFPRISAMRFDFSRSRLGPGVFEVIRNSRGGSTPTKIFGRENKATDEKWEKPQFPESCFARFRILGLGLNKTQAIELCSLCEFIDMKEKCLLLSTHTT